MAPLKIQLFSPYFVANKKLLLTYQIYAASQFFARALSDLKTLTFRGTINAMG